MQLTSLSLALTRAGFQSVAPPAFSPASLFASSEPGVWYDPSDFSTMFQDAAGTTPVTAVEQPVGLILDKSQGLVLGPELVTNGDFSSGTTGWTAGTVGSAVTLSVVNQRLRLTKTSTAAFGSAVQQITGLDAAKRYKFSCNGYVGTAEVRVLLGGAMEVGTVYNVAQSASDIAPVVYVTGVTSFWITVLAYGGNATYAEFDNISVRELPGNHATQTTSTSRPVLSARYNLLTKTEQFDAAVWTKYQAKITANSIVAPDGTTTADLLVENTAVAAGHSVFLAYMSAGTSQALSVFVKPFSGNRFLRIGISGSSDSYYDIQNKTNGTVASGFTMSSQEFGGGWIRVVLQGTFATGNLLIGMAAVDGQDTHTGDGTSGIYIWGASLVPANQASLPYQRVNTSTDYDTTGFPLYLKFDGVDDSLSTNSINFTSTDKMTVWAGVRKLSNTLYQMCAEFSSDVAANNGSFQLVTPDTASTYLFRSKGTTQQTATTGATYPPPTTNTLTGIGNISGDSVILRVNGIQAASSPADQGTGNYGNYPLYIGRRGGTTLPFNGRLYSMIVRGAQSTTDQITQTETWVNQRTGAYE